MRNAFGRQVDSFEADLEINCIGGPPVRAVFIRAPYAVKAGGDAEVLARCDDKIVLLKQGNSQKWLLFKLNFLERPQLLIVLKTTRLILI